MPSDERVDRVLEALAQPTQAFRATIATTAEEVRNFLATHGASTNGNAERTAAELGEFAAGRIDFARFMSLFGDAATLDQHALETIARGLETLTELAGREHTLFVCEVPSGDDLVRVVGRALADVGRAFGAARTVEMTRTRQYRYNEHARSLGSFPYTRWNRSERRVAPPIVVQVDGADLRVAGLAEFLDGSQKIVLVVRDPSPPAPLVRLITPKTMVLQTSDPGKLIRLTSYDGPGVAALVSGAAAHFIHDPAAGRAMWDRLAITADPDRVPHKPVGPLSPAQQAEELEQLRALAAKPAAAPAVPEADGQAAAVAPPADPVDRLASWLLSQADLSGVE
jgi:hypothetical protein